MIREHEDANKTDAHQSLHINAWYAPLTGAQTNQHNTH